MESTKMNMNEYFKLYPHHTLVQIMNGRSNKDIWLTCDDPTLQEHLIRITLDAGFSKNYALECIRRWSPTEELRQLRLTIWGILQ